MQHMLTILNQTFKLEIINNFIRGRDERLESVKLKHSLRADLVKM